MSVQRAPRNPRKGKKGCYVCGRPTEVTVQVWLRKFTGDRDQAGNRKQVSVKSKNISMCKEHGEAYFDHCVEGLPEVVSENSPGGTDLEHMRERWRENGCR